MQEELEQRTVSVSIQAAKLSGRVLRAAIAAVLQKMEQERTMPKVGRNSMKRLTYKDPGANKTGGFQMLKAELSRFKVKEGKSGKVDEWMAFLNDHMEDTLLTLENEKMFVESIHREVVNGTEFLYWYSVQGEGGTEVYDSESYIDIRHLEYWDECIDDDYKDNDIPAEVVMIPNKIRDVMK